MSELNFTGNCLKGSRPFLSFDASFEASPHTRLMKTLLSQVFGTPKNHPRSRPFIDHVFTFSLLGDKVWFRNFQVAEEVNDDTKKIEKTLVEIGPRFVLDPIRILAGGFSGAVLWDNPEYLTPSAERSLQKQEEAKEGIEKARKERKDEKRRAERRLGPGELDDVFADSDNEMDVDEDGEAGSEEEGEEGSDFDDENAMNVDSDLDSEDIDEDEESDEE
jgi:ribosome biogenesis protein BRX1